MSPLPRIVKPGANHQLAIIPAIILTLGLASIPSYAQTADKADETEKRLNKIQSEIKDAASRKEQLEQAAESAREAIDKISRDMVALGETIQLAEENIFRIERRITELEQEEAAKETSLSDRRGELSELLAALERLRRRPAVLALLQPSEALETAQSASLMSSIIPEINAQASALKDELSILVQIQNTLSTERLNLKDTLSDLADNQLELETLIAARREEASSTDQRIARENKRLQALASEAKSLRELLEEIERQRARLKDLATPGVKPEQVPGRSAPRKPGTVGRNFAAAKGNIPYPATGSVILRFGERDGFVDSRGIRIAGRQSGQVISPFDGQIVFAGPFRNYGNLLIIEHGDGYHSLLAGLDEIYGDIGQWVLTGEPVGSLNKATTTKPELYMELRRRGEAIDPLPWLRRTQADAR